MGKVLGKVECSNFADKIIGAAFKEMKRRTFYEKPSIKLKRKRAEASKRRRKLSGRKLSMTDDSATSSSLAGQPSMRDALIAAVAKSGRLDPLIEALERRKARTVRYRARRAEARREAM